MHNDTGVEWKNPGVSGEVRDALTDVLRQGAHQLLTQAIETEVAEFLARYRETRDEGGPTAHRAQWLPPAPFDPDRHWGRAGERSTGA